MAKKNKNQKRKAKLKARGKSQKQHQECVSSVVIDYKKIVRAFPDVQKRQAYISALCQEF